MNPIATQQAALNNALVHPKKRLKIERCNARIAFNKPQREETYEVTLEALKLSPFYPIFVITAKICPRILNQDFIAPPSEELVTFIQEHGYFGKCNMLYVIHTDQMRQPWRTFAAIINRCISGKTIGLDRLMYGALIPDDMINQDIKDSQAYKTYYDFATGKVPPRNTRKYKKVTSPLRKSSPVKETEPVKKGKQVKRHAKKSTTAPIVGVAIRDTPSDGTNYELCVPDKQQGKTSGIDEGTGAKPRVLDVPTYDFESKNESWGDSKDDNDYDSDEDSKGYKDKANGDDDGNSDANDNKRTNSDDNDENPSFTLKDNDEEEHDDEYESNDDNENLFEEEDDDLYKDVDSYEQVVEDAHVTLTSSQKNDSSKQSSSVSSDFASKFIILENVPPVINEVCSMMNVKSRQEESSIKAPSLFTVPVTAISETAIAHVTTVPLTISMITPRPKLMTPSPAPTTVPTTTLIPAFLDFSSLFKFDQRVSTLEMKLS
nr:hypothetical protein [Tanacetum cinerariifolium]